jgi:superfamily II DNA or RNA helicase
MIRDYQQQGIHDIREAFALYKRVLYTLPTGGGKSIIMAEIVKQAIAKGSRVHLVVHRDKLLQQLHDRIYNLLPDTSLGWVKAGKPLSSDACIQLVSIQSWKSRKEYLPPPNLVIVDEAHRGRANTYLAHQQAYPNAYHLGVTATPCTLGGAGLRCAYDYLVSGPSILELINHGYLAPIDYKRFDPIIKALGAPGSNGEFQLGQISKKIHPSDYSPALIASYNDYAAGQPTLVFAIDTFHADQLVIDYCEAGIPAGAYTSSHSHSHNKQMLDQYLAGKLLALITVDIFNEGVDLPFVSCLQLARPTNSLRIYLQQIGRVTRYVPGKTGLILDHVDNFIRHGHPLAPRKWTLDGELNDIKRREEQKQKRTKNKIPIELKKIGVTSAKFNKILELDESSYWLSFVNKQIIHIVEHNKNPTSLMFALIHARLDPPWEIFELAGKWLTARKAAKRGFAYNAFKQRYGFPPDVNRKPTPDWGELIQLNKGE